MVRHYKPQPEAYLKTADFLGLAPAGCLLVVAHENDLEAAVACGLRTAYVHRSSEYDDDPGKPGQFACMPDPKGPHSHPWFTMT